MPTLTVLVLAALLVQAAAPAASTAMVAGRVLNAGTSAPLPDAIVELVPLQRLPTAAAGLQFAVPRPVLPAPVRSGSDGGFRIPDVPAGEYRLYATSVNGYVPFEYGQRSPEGSGLPLRLAAGQVMENVSLSLTRTGAISGRIVDAANDPAPFVSVLAFRVTYTADGRRSSVAQRALTDDKGYFRIFGLAPGSYSIGAIPIAQRMLTVNPALPSRTGSIEYAGAPPVTLRAMEDGSVVEESYRPVYYPDATDPRGAQPVLVEPGGDVRISMSLANSPIRTARVRGSVTDASGQPLAEANLSLMPRILEGLGVVPQTAVSRADGTFTLPGVSPGSYTLFVQRTLPAQPAATPGALLRNIASPPALSALLPLDVAASGIDDLRIQTVPAVAIPWQVRFEGQRESDPPPAWAVTLVRDPAIPDAPSTVARTASQAAVYSGPDGTARVVQLAPQPVLEGVLSGNYRVVISPMPASGYVKSIRLGNADVLQNGIRISGPLEDVVEITVSAKGGTVGGIVVDGSRQPFANATVALVPADRSRLTFDPVKSVASGPEGDFRIEGLRPGEYRAFAWEAVSPGDWYDPDMVQRSGALGTSLRVEEGSAVAIQLAVIRSGAGR